MDDAGFRLARRTILEVLQLDIEQYKSQQMRRRLGSFIERTAGGDVQAFCRRLGEDAAFAGELRDFLTINVSEFFRDPDQFAYLASHVLPELLSRPGRLRIWSAGCAAGEEPYSIAMLFEELGALARVEILATDIDGKALIKARAAGPYGDTQARYAGRTRLQRFFRTSSEGLWLKDRVANAVMFRQHDLLGPTPGTGYDLIVCRNTMIYFAAEAKAALLRRLHTALRPGGRLFVGGTEGLIGSEQQAFRRVAGHFYARQEPGPAQDAERNAA